MTTKQDQTEFLIEATPYFQKCRNKIGVIEYGGNLMPSDGRKNFVVRGSILLSVIGAIVFSCRGGTSKGVSSERKANEAGNIGSQYKKETIRRGVDRAFIADGKMNRSVFSEAFSDFKTNGKVVNRG